MINFSKNKKLAKKIIYKKNNRANWKRRLIINASLAFLVFIFWALFLSPWMIIKSIKITGAKTIDKGKVEELARETMAGDYFYFVPRAKIFLIKPGNLSDLLKKKYPVLLQTNIRRVFPNEISLHIVERAPLGIWCKRNVKDERYLNGYDGLRARFAESQNYSAVSCYDYDFEGVIFQQAPYTSGSLIVKIYNYSPEAGSFDIGEKVMEDDLLRLIGSAEKNLNDELGLKVEQIILGKENAGVTLYLTSGWFLILNQNLNLDSQLVVLKNVLNQSIGDQVSNLAYIDLRIQNRAYYKYK